MRKTRIIVPCYNEAKRLKPDEFLLALEKDVSLSFLFVNDGSTDGTAGILNLLKEKNPGRIEVLNLEKNSGKAEAVRRGMLASLDRRFENVGYWDADLATPLAEIECFCRLLDSAGVNMAIGSRVLLLGRRIKRRAVKHYLGRVFATCASLLLGIGVYDTQCGAKIFRNRGVLRQVFGRPFKVNWTFDVEMLARFTIAEHLSPLETSAGWVEVPLMEWIDIKGSKVAFKDYIRGGFEFCTLFFYLRTPARKLYEDYLKGEDHGNC